MLPPLSLKYSIYQQVAKDMLQCYKHMFSQAMDGGYLIHIMEPCKVYPFRGMLGNLSLACRIVNVFWMVILPHRRLTIIVKPACSSGPTVSALQTMRCIQHIAGEQNAVRLGRVEINLVNKREALIFWLRHQAQKCPFARAITSKFDKHMWRAARTVGVLLALRFVSTSTKAITMQILTVDGCTIT